MQIKELYEEFTWLTLFCLLVLVCPIHQRILKQLGLRIPTIPAITPVLMACEFRTLDV